MPRTPGQITTVSKQAGFTLLELLLVVGILSSLALMSTTFVDNQDGQERFEETKRRLDLIHFAIVGENRPVYGGQALLSGYVADNGRLPNSIQQLLQKPGSETASVVSDDYDEFNLRSPVFDADPDPVSGLNNGGNQISLDAGSEQLPKGHRGAYLTPDSQGRFVDGWGNTGPAPDYGWHTTNTPASFTVTSLGRDNLTGGAGYDMDLSRAITAPAWQFTNIAGWQVTIRNASGTDLKATESNFRASLLVYVNDTQSATGRWLRFTTDRLASCLDGDGDGHVESAPCPSTATLTFPTGGYPIGALSTAIPQGRHILVLVQDSDNIAHSGGSDQVYLSGANRITQQVTFFAGMSPPGAELIIR